MQGTKNHKRAMKNILVCISIHHGNTKKIANSMAEVLGAEVVKPKQIDQERLKKQDLIDFGSGIYYRKHHRSVFKLVEDLPEVDDKKAFVFSTSGLLPTNSP